MRWPFDFLYGAVAADFRSAFPLEESVKRLSAVTERTTRRPLAREIAVGHVSLDQVSLCRVKPSFKNSCKPFFIGKFHQTSDGVVLSGRFTMLWRVKAFITFWFGFCVFLIVLAILPALARDPRAWWLLLAGAGVFLAGVAFVAFFKWLSRDDPAWLSKVIRDGLSTRQAHGGRLAAGGGGWSGCLRKV